MAHQGADDKRLVETLAGIQKKYVVLSGKGGVGKTSVAAATALRCADAGAAVLARASTSMAAPAQTRRFDILFLLRRAGGRLARIAAASVRGPTRGRLDLPATNGA